MNDSGDNAWLIERRRMNIPEWLCMMSGFEWTRDANNALKFADKQSAEDIAAYIGGDDELFIYEHGWPDGF